METIKIKKLNENAKIPTRGSEYAAGYDLYACLDNDYLDIPPHKTEKVSTGIALELPHKYFGAIFARSGLAAKKNLRPSNCVGICDEDYTGEYIVALHNDSDHTKTISNGERVAQLVLLPYLSIEFEEVNELTETKRGDGGFGSTGKA